MDDIVEFVVGMAVIIITGIAVGLLIFLFGSIITFKPTPVQPERYQACLIVKQDELFCLSYERENQ